MPAALRSLAAPVLMLLAAAPVIGLLAGVDPVLALGASFAVGFMLVILADLYVGLLLFIVLTFFADLPSYGGSAVSFSKLAGLVLAISWLATLAVGRRRRTDFISSHPAASWALLAFLGWAALSQLWADSPSTSLDAVFRLSLNVVFFVIVFTAVRTRAQAIGVTAAFIAGACLDAIYGLLNPVDVANTARLAGSASKPGELAAALVGGLVLSVGLVALLRRNPVARLTATIAASICAVGVFLTGSRGGLVALAMALATFIIVGARWRGRLLALAAALAVAGVGFYTYAASPDLRARVTSVGTGSGRTDLWTVAWRMVEAHPLEGVGIGNFPGSSVNYVLTPGTVARAQYVIDSPKVAHNTYLELWAETGLVGLTLFALIVAFCVRCAHRAAHEFKRREDAPMELLSIALLVAQVGFLAGAFFTSREYSKDIWLILALGPTFLSVARAQPSERPAGERTAEHIPGRAASALPGP